MAKHWFEENDEGDSGPHPLHFGFACFSPNRRALLDRLRRDVDDSMLREISQADNCCEEEKHYLALATLHASGEVPPTLEWHPLEALQLTRYLEPDDPGSRPFASGRRGHLVRLFAATILSRSLGESRSFEEGFLDCDLAQAVGSVQRLGSDYADLAIRYFAWLAERASNNVDGQLSSVMAIVAVWPFVSDPRSGRNVFSSLLDAIEASSSIDDVWRMLFSLGRWQLVLETACEQARARSLNGGDVSRKSVARIDALAKRIRDLTFPPGMPKPWD